MSLNGPGSLLEKTHFCPIFDAFLVPKWPIFKALFNFRSAKMGQYGLKVGSFHLSLHPKWSWVILGKHVFDPFLTYFQFQKWPIFRHFGIFGVPIGPPHARNRLNPLFGGIPRGLVASLKKPQILPPVDPKDLFEARPQAGCLPAPNGHRYRDLSIRIGNIDVWKPTSGGLWVD